MHANDTALADLLLAFADDKLMLGHAGSEWTGVSPTLEEDIASSSLAQDHIAHAQALYEVAGARLGRTADQLAFGRNEDEYRCATLVEIDAELDWGLALCRLVFCNTYDQLRFERLGASSDTELAALARRLGSEQRIHLGYLQGWIARLAQGEESSRIRLQKTLDDLVVDAAMFAETTAEEASLVDAGLYPELQRGDMVDAWHADVSALLSDAGLTVSLARPTGPGGRRGVHSPRFTALLDQMCEVYRLEPEAAW